MPHSTQLPHLNREYSNLALMLRDSFIPGRGVPLQLGEDTNYFASVTATVLLALHHVNALEERHYNEFYDTLFWLRDNAVEPNGTVKKPEDAAAWDTQESPSVWTTSAVLWGFLGTGYNGARVNELKQSVLWLVQQQRNDGGWGYDIQSKSNMFFTALTLHVLRLALASNISFSKQEQSNISRAKTFGLQYVLAQFHQDKGLAYCKIDIHRDECADPTATLMAMWVLFNEDPLQYKTLITDGIAYLRTTMENGIWGFKEVAIEHQTTTKYAVFKVVKSFSPSFVIFLLRAGCSPFDEICCGPIRWFQEHKRDDGWPLPEYKDGGNFTFATAYAIWAVAMWNRYVRAETLSRAATTAMIFSAADQVTSLQNENKTLRIWVVVLSAFAIMLFLALLLVISPVLEWLAGLISFILSVHPYMEATLTVLGIAGLLISMLRLMPVAIHRVRSYINR